MATYLDAILEAHRSAAAADRRPLDRLIDEATACPPTVPAEAALTAGTTLAVIAEVKRASPSKGPLSPDLDPTDLARTYALAGASMVSVLTDEQFFSGSPTDLTAARRGFAGPLLRKDFTVSAADVCDARLMGADVVLLIAAALDDAELADFAQLARQVGLAALVEAHDETEVARAIEVADARLVGVNQRDLVTFRVDTDRAVRVAAVIPDGVVAIAESGVRGPDDARRLAAAGYHAVLVGEHLVTADDPAAALAGLAVPRRAPPTMAR